MQMRSLLYPPLGVLLVAVSISACRPQPQTSNDWFEKGMTQIQNREVDAAIKSFDRAIALGNPSAAAYLNRGILHDEKGDYAAAIADYTTAIKQSPNLDEAYYNRGNTYHQLGEFKKSVADYSKAIEIKPDYAYAYANRSMSHEQMGKINFALADLKSALKIFQAEGDTANEARVIQEIKRVGRLKEQSTQ